MLTIIEGSLLRINLSITGESIDSKRIITNLQNFKVYYFTFNIIIVQLSSHRLIIFVSVTCNMKKRPTTLKITKNFGHQL